MQPLDLVALSNMRVAIAGAGDMAKYFTEELLAIGHEVVVLSRSRKDWFNRDDIEFRQTDYSVESLVGLIEDCQGLVSGILDYSMNSATVHLALLEACRRSPQCKKFVPSEYAGNTDEYPDEPAFYAANHNPVREALRAQDEVIWTLFNLGWLTDYLVPASSRYIKDIGDYHPVDFHKGKITIPGSGDEPIAFTAARDGAKAIAQLMSLGKWEPITYVAGEMSSWNKVADILDKRGYHLKKSYRPVALLHQQVERAETEEQVIAAQYELWSVSGAGFLPQDKLKRQAETCFKGIKFRTIEEVMDDAVKNPGAAV